MEKETLKKIFTFLEEEENKDKPFMWKLMNNEPLTDEELFVEGDLDLTFINIISLPKGLKVNGNLFLGDSSIKSLPEGLQVGGNLNIRNTPLAKRSDQYLLKMIGPTGNIKGSINR